MRGLGGKGRVYMFITVKDMFIYWEQGDTVHG
jgi:hypothetical protein